MPRPKIEKSVAKSKTITIRVDETQFETLKTKFGTRPSGGQLRDFLFDEMREADRQDTLKFFDERLREIESTLAFLLSATKMFSRKSDEAAVEIGEMRKAVDSHTHSLHALTKTAESSVRFMKVIADRELEKDDADDDEPQPRHFNITKGH